MFLGIIERKKIAKLCSDWAKKVKKNYVIFRFLVCYLEH